MSKTASKERLVLELQPRTSRKIEPERVKAVLKRLLRDFDLRAVSAIVEPPSESESEVGDGR